MTARFSVGDAVQTPLGKGIVREVQNNGRLRVEVHQRMLVLEGASLTARPGDRREARSAKGRDASEQIDHPVPPRGLVEVDLHGLTVEEALTLVDRALNDALLAEGLELRFIHGRTGGRIRGALHRHLREIGSVRGFRLDPRNEGVTIVSF